MAVLCRRFGVSRNTGYKILERYNSCGLVGLTDRSRRSPDHHIIIQSPRLQSEKFVFGVDCSATGK
jgi:hypothetical protein